jgi:ABC-type antimicrobial peptide transport system permease subunit
MTLGAKPLDVIQLVLGQSLVMIFVGVGVGTFAALAAARILNRLVEGMRPADISTFAITIPVLIIAALFASFVTARCASRIDPLTALRQQ